MSELLATIPHGDAIFMTMMSAICAGTAVYAVCKGEIDWFYGRVWTRVVYYDPIKADDDFLAFWFCVLLYAGMSAVSGYFACLAWTGGLARIGITAGR